MIVKDKTYVCLLILVLFSLIAISAAQNFWKVHHPDSHQENRPRDKREKIIWCTVNSEEQQKCLNFAMANERDRIRVGYRYIQIGCHQAFNKDECMALLDEEKATMTTLDAGMIFNGGRYHSLVPIAQEVLDGGFKHYYAVAVVKKGTLPDVRSLYDLRHRRACFAGVETFAGWILPINILMKEGGMEIIDCNNHVKSASNYFGSSCAVNCLTDKYNPIGDNSDRLCQLCIGKIPGGRCTDSDPYAGYDGAFKCLLEVGEIAFLRHTTVPELVAGMDFAGLSVDNFELLCKDGSRRPIHDYLSCSWGKVPSDAIVVSSAVSFDDRVIFQKFLQKFAERYPKTNYTPTHNNQFDKFGNKIQQQLDQFGNPIPTQQFDQFGNKIQPQLDQFGNPIPSQQFDQFGNRIQPQLDQFGNKAQPQFDQFGNRVPNNQFGNLDANRNRFKRQSFDSNDPYAENNDPYNRDSSKDKNTSPNRDVNKDDPYNSDPYKKDPYADGKDSYDDRNKDKNRDSNRDNANKNKGDPYSDPYSPDRGKDDPYNQDPYNSNLNRDKNQKDPSNRDPNYYFNNQNNDYFGNNPNKNENIDPYGNPTSTPNRNTDPFARDPYSINRGQYGVNIDPYERDPSSHDVNRDQFRPHTDRPLDYDTPYSNRTNVTYYETFSLFESARYGLHGNLLFQDSTRFIAPVPESLQTYTNFLGESLKVIMGVRDCPVDRMTLCVTSDAENAKCAKMSTAIKAQLLKPELNCYKGHSQIHCMQAIRGGTADVAVLDASDVYTAGLQYDLVPFISEVYNLEEPEYYVVAVAKEVDKSTDLTYLKGKYTCHGGINTAAGWVYPLAFLISNGWIRPYGCNSIRAAAEYFSKSCVPGALSTEYNTGVPYDNMCDLCHGPSFRYCRRDASEDYYGHTGAFRCLVEGGGQVAFVKHTTVTENTGGKKREWWARDNLNDDFELLCPDGTRAEINEYSKCNLGKVKANAIVTRGGYGYNETHINAYINLFMYAQTFYGRTTTDEFSFSMFSSEPPFSDLIFQDATTQLKVIEPSKRYYSVYLGSDFMRARRIVDCHAGSASISASLYTLIITFATLILIRH